MRVFGTTGGILLLIPHEIASWGWWTDVAGGLIALAAVTLLQGQVRTAETR